MKKTTKDNKISNTLNTIKFIIKFVYNKKYGKIFVFFQAISALLNAVSPLVLTVMPGIIINELISQQRMTFIILFVGILLIFPVINNVILAVLNTYLQKYKLKLNLQFEKDFYGHTLCMDYESLEKPEIQILKQRAEKTLSQILIGVEVLFSFVSALVSFLTISSIVITLNPIIVILIVLLICLNSLLSKRQNRIMHEISKELSKYDKYQGAYVYMLNQFEYAKEIRIFDIKNYLISIYSNSKIKSNELEIDYYKANNLPALFNSIANFSQQLILYMYLINKVINKNISVGSMTVYLSAAAQFSNSLSKVFNTFLSISNMSLDIYEYLDFMNIPLLQYKTGKISPCFNKNSVIEFKNVSFKYPGCEKYALKNLNLVIRGDEKLCIVGVNGSGKSTFIKLLTRLYFPTEGEILLNGININKYDYKQYQQLFAPVFQDFANYYLTLGENVALTNEYDLEKLNKHCIDCGLGNLVQKLQKGYDTQVGKWIDEEGFNPSGGEEQRIAIARACYKSREIYLLDEPTAALDPLAEYEIYTHFNTMITDKCAILITHRLSAVQLADKIAVFDNGRVIEYGTHDELYEKGGIYTEMFDKQAQFYRDNEKDND